MIARRGLAFAPFGSMLNRIRRFFESLAYAGLKPSGGVPAEAKPRRLGRLRDRVELFLNGGQPSDPLYLSNRTWKHKLRLALLIAIPVALVFGALALVFTNVYTPKAPPPKEVSAAEMLARLLPDLQKTSGINAYKDAEIVELRVAPGAAPRIAGVLKNNTDRVISVEFELDLVSIRGSRVGAATWRVDKAPPNASVPFDFPAGNSEAVYVLVRKMRTVQ
jgi:hypothetical protein